MDHNSNLSIFPIHSLSIKYLQNPIFHVQLTLVISTSLNSNNHLSRGENLVPVYTMKILQQVIKYCGKEEKLLLRSNFSSFPQYFQLVSNESNYILFDLFFRQFCKSDM